MKQFTRTVTLASALTVFAASQLLFPQAAQTGTSYLKQPEGSLHGLNGLTCISEKLFFPKPPPPPPDEEEEETPSLAVLTRYGE